MALYLLGAIIQNHGHNVKIVDPSIIRKYKPYRDNDKLRSFIQHSLIGIDVVCISGNTINWKTNKYLIELIRSLNRTVKIIMGGLHVSYFYKYTMQTNEIDYIVRDEGEISLVALIDALAVNSSDIRDIPGLVYRHNGEILTNEPVVLTKEQLQESPLPMYEQMPKDTYPMMPIMTSRGCRYGCRFCSVPRKYNWIGLDEEYVINYIKRITDKFSAKFLTNCIYFTDDCFTADSNRACKILDGIAPFDVNVSIEARARDLKSLELLKRLQSNKVQRIAIGVECGYNEGLKRINKGLTVEDVIEVLSLLKEHDLIEKAWCSFIYGFPWETVDDCVKTIDFAAYIVKNFGVKVNINMLSLFPSQIWNERKEYGIEVDESHFDTETLTSESGFFTTHPNFSYSDVNFLLKRIYDYEAKNIVLRSK